ncbi:uncharacterized protein LOC132715946 [Ruditapes philippinarum]|uniref:uncharacterized protein LOC132715946 n=1 Tax=Ruditapes philippinarum TaxID=129788 RepID=UPI00295B42D8|nr:uncharacterized protein LOC132715946 [Ruditapes philippinarum]XP_060555046.1 uncharacterized protein LOC132715946 [Ruditapes philippinarum]XP_060555048.1 uncharacterized protein LOC132715946 [Ruditapes philippinarum]
MAQKGGYPGNPPPYYAAPGAAVYNIPNAGQNVTIVQGQPHVVTKSSRGLFGQIGHEINLLGKTISREVDWTADQINKSLATTAQGNILNLFQSGNVIQLVSRSSGRSLEIVQGPASLIVDGLGQDNAPNATWTVVNEGGNQVRLHNNNNFLAIINGATVLINMPPGTMHGIETKFQLTQRLQFVHLESMKERGKHIGILPSGLLKAALATGKEDHSMFGVRLIYSPYGVAAAGKH